MNLLIIGVIANNHLRKAEWPNFCPRVSKYVSALIVLLNGTEMWLYIKKKEIFHFIHGF